MASVYLRYVVVFCLFVNSMQLYSQQNTKTHLVKQGESIESIARQYNISVEELKKANPNNSGMLFAGLYLLIPEKKVVVATQPVTIVNEDKDKIALKDGSEIVCTITEMTNTTVFFMQQGEYKQYSKPIQEMLYVVYEGKTTKFNKRR